MIPLSEVAADVVQALQLDMEPSCFSIIDPYWRCRCEDWLLANGHDFQAKACMEALRCPWSEAPARLVSAVWRKSESSGLLCGR